MKKFFPDTINFENNNSLLLRRIVDKSLIKQLDLSGDKLACQQIWLPCNFTLKNVYGYFPEQINYSPQFFVYFRHFGTSTKNVAKNIGSIAQKYGAYQYYGVEDFSQIADIVVGELKDCFWKLDGTKLEDYIIGIQKRRRGIYSINLLWSLIGLRFAKEGYGKLEMFFKESNSLLSFHYYKILMRYIEDAFGMMAYIKRRKI